jgi:hypothetical protein
MRRNILFLNGPLESEVRFLGGYSTLGFHSGGRENCCALVVLQSRTNCKHRPGAGGGVLLRCS